MNFLSAERRQLLESFGSAPTALGAALRTFPRRMWVYKDSANAQSIHDIVWQLADNEAVEFIYCRRFIAYSPPSPFVVDSSGLPGRLGYFYQNVKEAMGIIRALRPATYRFLKTLPDAAWDSPIELPTYGKLTLHQWLQMQERFIPDHIEKMHQIYVAWLDARFKVTWTSVPSNAGAVGMPAEAEASARGTQR
jgi:hypothetical protein